MVCHNALLTLHGRDENLSGQELNRKIALPGSLNFRDFGGYNTLSNERVCTGRLYRSGRLSDIAQDGHADFSALDIRVICDLRTVQERADHPTPFLGDDVKNIHIPMDPGNASMLAKVLFERSTSSSDRKRIVTKFTSDLVRYHASDYKRMFAVLQAECEGGFLVHCSAGRDRTGIGVALILLVLGVPQKQVMDDYLMTNDLLDFERFILPQLAKMYGDVKIDSDVARSLATLHADYLRAAFDEMVRSHGSVDGYLTNAIGLSTSDRARMRARFLE
jgi:protein-tyrosine phosphatase